jgi:hypothetical protein
VPTHGQLIITLIPGLIPLMHRIDGPIPPLQLPQLPLEPLPILSLHLLNHIQPPQNDILTHIQTLILVQLE